MPDKIRVKGGNSLRFPDSLEKNCKAFPDIPFAPNARGTIIRREERRTEQMIWPFSTEREKWASRFTTAPGREQLGLPALDVRSRALYETGLPRGVLLPRFTPDRARVNYWMAPSDLMHYAYRPGQIVVGKFAGRFLGHLDDRPMVTIAGARAGKTSTVLEPNLYLYPGSTWPDLNATARTAVLRGLGHDVHILDPFSQSGEISACLMLRRNRPSDVIDDASQSRMP